MESLKSYNTFGLEASANEICEFNSVDKLKSLVSIYGKQNHMILGGGSNVLFTQNFNGVVLLNRIKGKEIIFEDDKSVHIKVGAGEVWHDFVLYCVENNWSGIENLSLIPGSVGASPMQNIGAYGVEIKDVFISLEALNKKTLNFESFDKEECEFGYRESIFKRRLKGEYVISSVTFRLSKEFKINSSYGAIEAELKTTGITEPSIKDISDAIIKIRSSKLPNPSEIGNAGSFFKNPVVEKEVLAKIEEKYDNVPNYPAPNDKVKLAAGWLIEKAGWKGKRVLDYGVHEKQALVLVNYGNSDGKDIYNLSTTIIDDIELKFGVKLEREVNII